LFVLRVFVVCSFFVSLWFKSSRRRMHPKAPPARLAQIGRRLARDAHRRRLEEKTRPR